MRLQTLLPLPTPGTQWYPIDAVGPRERLLGIGRAWRKGHARSIASPRSSLGFTCSFWQYNPLPSSIPSYSLLRRAPCMAKKASYVSPCPPPQGWLQALSWAGAQWKHYKYSHHFYPKIKIKNEITKTQGCLAKRLHRRIYWKKIRADTTVGERNSLQAMPEALFLPESPHHSSHTRQESH